MSKKSGESVEKRTKTEALHRMRELRDIINSCDPVGLMACGCPDDEYECIVPVVFRQLQTGRKPLEVAAELGPHIEDHFGIRPTKEVLERLFERASDCTGILRNARFRTHC